MKSLNYLTIGFLIFFGCNSSHKSGDTSNQRNNIFINEKIEFSNYITVNDVDNRDDFYVIKKNKKFGLINNKKKLLLPLEYDTIERPHLADYFFISKKNLFGVVTLEGILTVPITYEHIEYDWKEQKSEDEDCFIVQKNKKLGSIDFRNNKIIPIEFDGISNWVEYGPDAHYVKKGKQYGIIDYNTGKLIIPIKYDGIYDHKGLIEIKKNNHYGILSWKNKEIIPCIYDRLFLDIDYFGFEENHKNRILARKDKVWYEFLLSGKLLKSNISTKEIGEKILKYEPDSNEFSYHLKDCMTFPK